MTESLAILFACGALLAVAGAFFGLLVLLGSRNILLLDEALAAEGLSTAPAGLRLPSLAVVVTARDEAAGIETTVRRLLAQRYPALEVIVVDDRSTDGTGDILDRLAAETPRLVVVHNRSLPQGWLGKCNACRLGAGRAGGEWILFTDGDVALATDDLLARVVALAERRRLDHVAVLPDLRPMSPLQGGLVAAFGQMFVLAARAFEMPRDLSRGGAGVGAFNLMKRSAYERVGGHDLVRLDMGDDFKLGRLLKESGARQRLFFGVSLVRCSWHEGTLRVIRGLEKNFFAGLDYSVAQLVAFSAVLLLISFGPAAAAILATLLAPRGTPALVLAAGWLPFALQFGFLLYGYLTQGRRYGVPPLRTALLHPLSVLLLLAAAWNSAIRTLLRGGVTWRETFYPLAALRQGLLRPGVGRRLGCA
ncbi:MAG TPA: glycosyltransferase [Candidatus Polarisedimenticolia bacterium]|nr:glycosyltransferase [Candidatus Polarisedimenticolia bacterium]